MKKFAITLTAIATMIMSGSAASANDLVKALSVLQSLNGGHNHSHRGPSHRDGYGRNRVVVNHSSRPVGYVVKSSSTYRDRDYGPSPRAAALEASRRRALERAAHLAQLERLAELKRLERLDRSRHVTTARVTFRPGHQVNPLPLPPAPVAPVYVPPAPQLPVYVEPRPILPAPHVHAPAFGEIVTCEVPLYKRVRVRNRRDIACTARPMVVAVKSPSACDHACKCCADEVTYVTVMAPPCEPKCVTVSPCGRKIAMDFGQHEIKIVAMNNYVKVNYDN